MSFQFAMRYRIPVLLGICPPAFAATVQFDPPGEVVPFVPVTVTEDLTNSIFDDELDVGAETAAGDPAAIQSGDTGKWDYAYKRPYRILSGDDVDLDLTLSLKPSGLNGAGTIRKLTFYLTGPEGQIPGTLITAGPTNFLGTTNPISFFGNYVLGNLKGKTITDFHLEFTTSSGLINWHDTHVHLEADDIEPAPVPLPAAALSLAAALGLLAGARCRRTGPGTPALAA